MWRECSTVGHSSMIQPPWMTPQTQTQMQAHPHRMAGRRQQRNDPSNERGIGWAETVPRQDRVKEQDLELRMCWTIKESHILDAINGQLTHRECFSLSTFVYVVMWCISAVCVSASMCVDVCCCCVGIVFLFVFLFRFELFSDYEICRSHNKWHMTFIYIHIRVSGWFPLDLCVVFFHSVDLLETFCAFPLAFAFT